MIKTPTGLLFFCGFISVATHTYAQDPPADSHFYNPTFGTNMASFQPSVGDSDDTQALNNIINTLSATPSGGTIQVAAGTYRLRDVKLKSNVHLRFNSNATVLPTSIAGTGNVPIFRADSNSGPLNNFSIEGVGGKFSIDISSYSPADRIRAVTFGHAENFRVANFDVQDNFTAHSVLAFGANTQSVDTANGRRITSVRGVASGGIVENVSVQNAHYGYGMVQVQAGNNLLFRDVAAEGGVALRLESGYELLQFATNDQFAQIKVDQIYGRGISSRNGQAAVTLSPHTLDQGTVNLADIDSVSSETGIVWSAGFVSKKTGEQIAAGLTPGSFAGDSIIQNVEVTFGDDAQLHPSKRLRFVPCQLRHERVDGVGISVALSVDEESRLGPSIASVIRTGDAAGDYQINFPVSEVTAHGFNIAEHLLPKNAFVTDSHDDFEECTETIPGVNFFVPRDYRGTPNRTLTAVPEPSSAIYVMGMTVGWLMRRRRQS